MDKIPCHIISVDAIGLKIMRKLRRLARFTRKGSPTAGLELCYKEGDIVRFHVICVPNSFELAMRLIIEFTRICERLLG